MGSPLALILCVLVIAQCLLSTAVVAPSDHGSHRQAHGILHGATSNISRNSFDQPRSAEKQLLRLMPLGASITQGWDVGIAYDLQSGYRKPLRQQLRYLGYPVNMVGSRAQGDFFDRQHEGWPGLEINQVTQRMLPVLTTQKPNLILILLGSNDCFHAKRDSNMEYARSAKDRMRSLIERIFIEANTTTVILATLPPTRDPSNEPYINTANAGFKDLARELQEQGRKIELVDMYTTWLLAEDYSDSIHFKFSGYAKLAARFAQAFSRVEAKGWLTPPPDTDISDNAGCYPSPDGFRGPVRTQRGSGHDDGDFAYSSKFENSKDLSYADAAPRSLIGHFHFANLVQLPDEVQLWDELIRILDPEDRKAGQLPSVSYFTNKGDGNFEKISTTIDVGQDCSSQGVRWADFNGDGLDDFICFDGDGIPYVSLNRASNPPNFEFIGAIREEKATQAEIHLADIDGDSRTDFCTVEKDGVYCSRNGGVGHDGYWEDFVPDGATILALDPSLETSGTRLIDINGDGRADWLSILNTTHTDIRINQRGDRTDGLGLKPHWSNPSTQIADWPENAEVTKDHILFGRVFGSGRNDVVRMEQVGNKFDYVFHFHRNTGKGGVELRGDGVRYCDIFGRGYDDYLWVSADGAIELFENVQNPPYWTAHGKILDTKRDRKLIHVGDWDGDGLCDILAVDRPTGHVDMWRNLPQQGNAKPTFAAPIRVVDTSLCPQPTTSSNFNDFAVRFGDLDGDKRVDYICVDPNGRTLGYINSPTSLTPISASSPAQIKISEGHPRADIHFADVNGDGKVDYLAVNPATGAVHTWINRGIKPSLTSGMSWDSQPDIWMKSMERGANVHFPKLGKEGRADYHVVWPRTGVADTWFNERGRCAGGARWTMGRCGIRGCRWCRGELGWEECAEFVGR